MKLRRSALAFVLISSWAVLNVAHASPTVESTRVQGAAGAIFVVENEVTPGPGVWVMVTATHTQDGDRVDIRMCETPLTCVDRSKDLTPGELTFGRSHSTARLETNVPDLGDVVVIFLVEERPLVQSRCYADEVAGGFVGTELPSPGQSFVGIGTHVGDWEIVGDFCGVVTSTAEFSVFRI